LSVRLTAGIAGESHSASGIMARPRRIQEPVKLNLLLEKTHKALALKLAAERRTSVSRLFVSWLLQDLDGQRLAEDLQVDNNPDT